jgi:hypothetical protein
VLFPRIRGIRNQAAPESLAIPASPPSPTTDIITGKHLDGDKGEHRAIVYIKSPITTEDVFNCVLISHHMNTYKYILTVALAVAISAMSANADNKQGDIKELAGNPDSDLTVFSGDHEALTEGAQIDAQEYFKTHKSLDLKHTDSNIGLAHALKHHLLGDDAHTYQVAFYTALDALLTDQ